MLIMYQLTTLPWFFNLMDDKTLKISRYVY